MSWTVTLGKENRTPKVNNAQISLSYQGTPSSSSDVDCKMIKYFEF
jgi:hypothetical protein